MKVSSGKLRVIQAASAEVQVQRTLGTINIVKRLTREQLGLVEAARVADCTCNLSIRNEGDHSWFQRMALSSEVTRSTYQLGRIHTCPVGQVLVPST